ncbi:MAG: YbjN domain-containing protein [Deltaproteobacteria bacterium]|nr:YbjN domain-containing protein [Deltaproteobacteria bacterium]
MTSKGAFDGDALEEMLERAGLPVAKIAETTWRSRLRGTTAMFSLFLRLDPGWLTFAILPYARSPQEAPASEKLYRRLLELNHTIMLAKFSIDDDLDVILSVEHPLENLDESEFRDAIDALTYYADRHWKEVAELSATADPPSGSMKAFGKGAASPGKKG